MLAFEISGDSMSLALNLVAVAWSAIMSFSLQKNRYKSDATIVNNVVES